jgi:hypothetical protein
MYEYIAPNKTFAVDETELTGAVARPPPPQSSPPKVEENCYEYIDVDKVHKQLEKKPPPLPKQRKAPPRELPKQPPPPASAPPDLPPRNALPPSTSSTSRAAKPVPSPPGEAPKSNKVLPVRPLPKAPDAKKRPQTAVIKPVVAEPPAPKPEPFKDFYLIPPKAIPKASTVREAPKVPRKTQRRLSEIPVLSCAELGEKLDALKLGRYKEKFATEQVDGRLLAELDRDALVADFGMSTVEASRLKLHSSEGWLPKQ